MADGLIDDSFGGEEDPAEAAGDEESIASGEAFGMAVAADFAKYHPAVARDVSEFLRDHSRLLKEQAAGYAEDQRLRMIQVLGQVREGRLRRLGQHIRLFMQIGAAAVFAAVGGAIVIMVVQAITSRAVVVDTFETPPGLAPRGISGKVVASAVLDGLQTLADATRALDRARAATSAWSSDIQIQLPDTGVSIGQIDRLLHQRLGHDLHVGGDLVQTVDGGLALTVRGDSVPPKTFTGGAGDLAKLTVQAAEYIYGSSQPVQFARYLDQHDRGADLLAFLPDAFSHADNDDLRSNYADLWGNAYMSMNQPAQAVEKYQLSLTLNPTEWASRSNLVGAVELAEGEEPAWRASQDMLRAIEAAPASKRPEKRRLLNMAAIAEDLPLDLEATLDDAAHSGGTGLTADADQPSIAEIYLQMHDPVSAARYMAASNPADPLAKAIGLLMPGYGALERNDAAAAVPPLEAFWHAWLADPDLQSSLADEQCNVGLAYGLAGRMADAEAVFKRAGPWNRCYADHGDVLAHAGDIEGAKRVWAEGQHVAPDLVHVYVHRGLWELSHGDLAAAATDFATAHKSAPHYADPLKGWGDLLARQGDWKGALAKYDEALQYAPNWALLQQARGVVAEKAK